MLAIIGLFIIPYLLIGGFCVGISEAENEDLALTIFTAWPLCILFCIVRAIYRTCKKLEWD